MNAEEAYKKLKEKWAEDEIKLLPYVAGFQTKVEQAIEGGQASCVAGVVPAGVVDFVSDYYESLGYWVSLQKATETDVVVHLNFKNLPYMARGHMAAMQFAQALL